MQGCDFGMHLDAQFDVEIGERFIHQKYRWMPYHGSPKRTMLTLAARQLSRALR